MKHLAERSGVKVEWFFNVTTLDPPELIRYIRRHHPDVTFLPPPDKFINLFLRHGFPTRRIRWCCEELKERVPPPGRTLLMGIRAAESARRAAKWDQISPHNVCHSKVLNPIYYWTDNHVWHYIRGNRIPYCELYDLGWPRIGCIGCPMGGSRQRRRQFAEWPAMAAKWRKAFHAYWNKRHGSLARNGQIWFGERYFHSADELYEWWLSDRSIPETPLASPLPALPAATLECQPS